jgi:hypothetical protein
VTTTANGSTADATAEIERTTTLRAIEAELAARAEKAATELAAARAATDAAAKPATTPAAPIVPAAPVWTPADAMSADAVRAAVASFGRAILNVIIDDEADIALARRVVYGFERGQLSTLIGAMEKGAGIKAAPRHTADCLETREWQASRNKPLVCLAGCPMLSVRTPAAPKPTATGTTVTTGTPAGGTSTPGHSKGNVEYHGPSGDFDSVQCSEAATYAARDYATATSCISWVAKKDSNARKALISDFRNDRVPAGTFGLQFAIDSVPEQKAA